MAHAEMTRARQFATADFRPRVFSTMKGVHQADVFIVANHWAFGAKCDGQSQAMGVQADNGDRGEIVNQLVSHDKMGALGTQRW